jgi:hypothetical protein
LFWTEPDLAFLAVCAPANLKSERRGLAFLSQTHVSATRLIREVALRDLKPSRTQNFRGQSLNQKFAFDFPIVWRSTLFLHKAKMLNAMSLVSRFSR